MQNNRLKIQNELAQAIALHQAGDLAGAERFYRLAIAQSPGEVAAFYRLGVLCFQKDRAEEAVTLLESALKLQPQNAGILSSLGVAAQIAGYDQKAVDYLQRAVAIKPDDPGILGNLGRSLREQRKFDAALEYFIKADQAKPDVPHILIEIGRCHYERERFAEAISFFEKALKLQPHSVEALGALGSTLWAMGDRAGARRYLERALQAAPQDAKTLLNFGEFLAFDEGNLDEALLYFNRALAAAPDYINAMWRKSFALLAKGDYREGWKLYADCLGNRETRGVNRFAPQKPWDGAPDPDMHLLIWCEQGLGDSLHFIRYAEQCKQRVGKVSVFCQKPLVRLFNGLPFITHASDVCDKNSFDAHVPVMSLPYLFDTRVETIPNAPYLRVDPALAAKWAAKCTKTDKVKIGLVWAGGGHEDNLIAKLTDRQRSITLEMMKPWLELEGVEFYSLQKDGPAAQIKEFGLENQLIDLMDEVTDFADTAALVLNLDLVITVDTAVAHLAGGLGKPVWILSRTNADWRWLENRPDSPWYPTARIFGQPKMGDWGSVITEITRALPGEIAKKERP